MQEQEKAAYDVEVHNNNLETLVSVHRECWNPWSWRAVAAAPAPSPPVRASAHEDAAKQAEAAFAPSLSDRLFGKEASKRKQLAEAVAHARQADTSAYGLALDQHRAAVESWQWFSRIAHGVLIQDVDAYRSVLEHLSPFEELQELGTTVSVDEVHGTVLSMSCRVRDENVIPKEERTLTARGKMTVKAMATGKYWALYQDHVCSCAIRVARETFALLPIPRVVVNVSTPMLDSQTGHVRDTTILGVNFLRESLDKLHLDTIDPSDSMRNFGHRMKFKKTAGFEPVDAIQVADGWANSR